MGMGMATELHPDVWRGKEKVSMTSFDIPNNVSSMKFALKSVPGFADVGVPHGDGDGPRAPAPGFRSKIPLHHVDQHEKLKGLDDL